MSTIKSTYINNEWILGRGAPMESVNPATQERIGRFAGSSVDQVSHAVQAARMAFESESWRSCGPTERSKILLNIAEALEQHGEELAQLVTSEVGTPISLSRGMQVANPIEVLRWYAEVALRGPYGSYETELPAYSNPVPSSSILVKEPAGVVAAMTAYNYPINLLAWKLGGALASGCTAVLLPSPRGALTSIRVMEIISQLDLPVGVVNMIVGGPDVGIALSSNKDVDLITFTGSDTVGGKVMSQAAENITETVLELGGKAANIVLPGVDLATAVPASVLRFCRNAGQGCGAWTRILVKREEMSSFVDAAVEYLASLEVGDPSDPDITIGPLISADHLQFVRRSVAEAVERGAKIAFGADDLGIDMPGNFMSPVLLTDVRVDDPICDLELFAPVAVVLPYDSVEEAIRIANTSAYGLNANITGRQEDAMVLARKLRVGTVTINNGSGMRPDAPWGGLGRSGTGRELGDSGFDQFFQVKHIQWPNS
ncbi:aldehyde dehydrogenase family protein [Rhodococcus sp. USK10]|uniref:aldehyde dehydrogenase family protein n=1 Tax=Rhodococcus sp. USK10 TaxID=2789739 RepID=UPI001C5D744C|nr:aldehyde dehydrogenase family protein [Rhodococcus sp. USK10]QYB07141.1 aldehyde dehydrogenase family protein [Rhodococcus sp. USK10]